MAEANAKTDAEFDYQWKNIDSKLLEYNDDRVKEFLKFTRIYQTFFKNKYCLDAGAGIGRYTYAMLELGAIVDSIDISQEAINKCKLVNSSSKVFNITDLKTNPVYDFVLSWGVLHHTENPRESFRKIVSQVKPNGILHVMLYHRDTQKKYEKYREQWKTIDENSRLKLCEQLARKYHGTVHGWWDALNPTYNYSYTEDEIKQWFIDEEFTNINIITKYNININGTKI